MIDDLDLPALRRLATDVATEAAAVLLDALHESRTEVTTKSTGTDMVTEMDRASEELIVRRIIAERPDDGIVGEEGADRAGTSGVQWVIDPLDGTTNYLYRLPGWNVSVGVEVDGRPVAGAVVVPTVGDTFSAALGHGATANGVPLVADRHGPPLAEALIGTGFSYDPAVRSRQAELLAALLPRVRDIRRMGAAAVDLCSVACGRLDAYYERGLSWWDLAAGGLIAAEAGATLSAIDGGPVEPGSVLAAAPPIATPLRDLLCSLGAQKVP